MNKWTYQVCYELAKECNSRSSLRQKHEQAYRAALRNGWINNYTWFIKLNHRPRPDRIKYTYEICRETALRYSTLRDFSKENPSMYTVAQRHGWIQDFCWLKRSVNIFNGHNDNVYAYFFDDLHAVYIGRTISPASRHHSHSTDIKSTVFKFACRNLVDVPQMTILETDLSVQEGLEREDYYRNKFDEDGWYVINIAKTGTKSGSLGGLGKGKLTRKFCYDVAKKYESLKDFRTLDASVYNCAVKKGWVADYTWLHKAKANGYWTYEMCCEESKKYNTRNSFRRGSSSAYGAALKNGWIDDYTWLVSIRTNWDYDTVREAAMKYTTLADFVRECGGAYHKAKANGWLADFDWLLVKDNSPKPVEQYSLDGVLIAKYTGAREASRMTNCTYSGISHCCNGKLKQHNGYIWKYSFAPQFV